MYSLGSLIQNFVAIVLEWGKNNGLLKCNFQASIFQLSISYSLVIGVEANLMVSVQMPLHRGTLHISILRCCMWGHGCWFLLMALDAMHCQHCLSKGEISCFS
jgi:hypothetical protein